MALDVDQEILQDFLIEAAEILELLSEELVELENDPENADLLNSIFRGFHTVKGGAGFLALTNLVDACHGAENVFDILRTGKRRVTPELMDVILQSLDTVNEMFAQVQAGEDPDPADPHLLELLHKYCVPESEEEQAAPASADTDDDGLFTDDVPAAPDSDDSGTIDEITEDEFEALLDELHGKPGPKKAAPAQPKPQPSSGASDSDEISDDEFEALLDELHGKGSFNSDGDSPEKVEKPAASAASPDEITDDEFESLLDELHGKGGGPTSKVEVKKPSEPEAPAKKETSPPAAAAKPSTPAKPAAAAAPAASPKAAEKKAPPPPQAETTVRVDTKRLDEIMNMVGELVLVRNRLVSLGVNFGSDEAMTKAISTKRSSAPWALPQPSTNNNFLQDS